MQPIARPLKFLIVLALPCAIQGCAAWSIPITAGDAGPAAALASFKPIGNRCAAPRDLQVEIAEHNAVIASQRAGEVVKLDVARDAELTAAQRTSCLSDIEKRRREIEAATKSANLS